MHTFASLFLVLLLTFSSVLILLGFSLSRRLSNESDSRVLHFDEYKRGSSIFVLQFEHCEVCNFKTNAMKSIILVCLLALADAVVPVKLHNQSAVGNATSKTKMT